MDSREIFIYANLSVRTSGYMRSPDDEEDQDCWDTYGVNSGIRLLCQAPSSDRRYIHSPLS